MTIWHIIWHLDILLNRHLQQLDLTLQLIRHIILHLDTLINRHLQQLDIRWQL